MELAEEEDWLVEELLEELDGEELLEELGLEELTELEDAELEEPEVVGLEEGMLEEGELDAEEETDFVAEEELPASWGSLEEGREEK